MSKKVKQSKSAKAAKPEKQPKVVKQPKAAKGPKAAGELESSRESKAVKNGRSGAADAVDLATAGATGERGAGAESGERETMPEEQLLRITRAIADPRRMAMLRTIARNDSTCSALRACTDVSAATLSHHMKELEHAGLIAMAKDGRFLQVKLQKKAWKQYVSSLKALAG